MNGLRKSDVLRGYQAFGRVFRRGARLEGKLVRAIVAATPSPTPGVTTRNAVLYSAEAIDRSPCGTGASAEMAARHAKGLLKLNQEFVSESIIGSLFYGSLVAETRAGDYPAVVPTIRGRAFISGIQQFVLDPRDPWPTGFYLGECSRWGGGG